MMAFVGSLGTGFTGSRVAVTRAPVRSVGLMGQSRVKMTLAPAREEISQVAGAAAEGWKVQLLYDSDCPLCMREVNFLTKRDGGRGLVDFVDVSDLSYSPDEHQGISFEDAMGRIHAVLPDGKVITGIDVFVTVYEALGMGWVYAVTKIPGVGKIADSVYNMWADARLQLTGRKDLAELVREREEALAEVQDCETSCKIEW
uniref:Thiol-disulfide oxidoreductase DCC n=1 Tax=Rhodosorus marinus TaxID=101924 RepID=A0A7S3ECF4_9RHOD|mmetsp:Transcript_22718/g.90998  ORF Transcript_22718/g.90998 Transcript_22718/m.90998 type:complete len:201 (+) Transcript_22718:124-726(+)